MVHVARTGVAAGAFGLALMLSSSAFAQNCSAVPLATPAGIVPYTNALAGMGSGIAAANAVGATVNAVNTAFLTQSSAFVGTPPNPEPGSVGGGAWVRTVVGEATIKSPGTVAVNVNNPTGNAFNSANFGGCAAQVKQTFSGVQFGQDIARLNLQGFNVSIGATAGMIDSRGYVVGGNLFSLPYHTSTQAPFAGTYIVVTRNGFFADALLRYNYYTTTLDSPTTNVFNQKLSAHGVTLAASAGYQWAVPDTSWYVEPSAGVVVSRTAIDTFNTSNPVQNAPGFAGGNFQGSTRFDDLNSTIGRLGLRVGTAFQVGNVNLQPFAAASVWKEFGGVSTSNYQSCFGCFFYTGPATLAASVRSPGIGTYGQYSLGLSGQVINTGWLAFARVDYRKGNNLEGLSGTAGVRYQFAADTPARAGIYKGPAIEAVADAPVNWNGVYLGAIGGAVAGTSTITFPAINQSAQPILSGLLLGGTVGYNYQLDRVVLGLEGDLSWLNGKGSRGCSGLVANFTAAAASTLFQANCLNQADWLGSVTARVGYSSDRVLYYAKAGVAVIHDTYSVTCNNGPTNGVNAAAQQCSNSISVLSPGFSVSETRVGWTAGFGSEFALNQNWSIKGEVDYADFGTRRLAAATDVVNARLQVVSSKVGVNYRFNFAGAGPVVARY